MLYTLNAVAALTAVAKAMAVRRSVPRRRKGCVTSREILDRRNSCARPDSLVSPAQDAPPGRPRYLPDAADQDWSFLKNAPKTDIWDPVKYIRLGREDWCHRKHAADLCMPWPQRQAELRWGLPVIPGIVLGRRRCGRLPGSDCERGIRRWAWGRTAILGGGAGGRRSPWIQRGEFGLPRHRSRRVPVRAGRRS